MARFSARVSVALATAIGLVCLASPHDGRPHRTASAVAGGVASEIDALLAQCDEQMNVKGQFQQAAVLAEEAWHLSERAGDRTRTSTSLVYLGAAYAYQGRLADALEVSQKNVALAREIGDQR